MQHPIRVQTASQSKQFWFAVFAKRNKPDYEQQQRETFAGGEDDGVSPTSPMVCPQHEKVCKVGKYKGKMQGNNYQIDIHKDLN